MILVLYRYKIAQNTLPMINLFIKYCSRVKILSEKFIHSVFDKNVFFEIDFVGNSEIFSIKFKKKNRKSQLFLLWNCSMCIRYQ